MGCHQVASALAACHAKGVIHQDLQLGNVMRTLDGAAWKLMDFGVASPTKVNGERNWLPELR